MFRIVRLLALALCCACRSEIPPASTPTPTPPAVAGFVAHDRDLGLDHVNVSGGPDKRYIVEANGPGVCVFDYDRDGDDDLYFVNGQSLDGSNSGRGRLYRNRGDGHFDDVSPAAGVGDDGWGFACAVADIDRDGWSDLFVTGWNTSRLYRAQGDGSFAELTAVAGLRHDGWGAAATFGDYDKDGFPDLFVARYLDFDPAEPPPGPEVRGYRGLTLLFKGPVGLDPQPDLLFHNRGDGTFDDVSVASGIRKAEPAYGLAAAFLDLDRDGWLDIYVANDSVANHAHRNDHHGGFTEVAYALGLALSDEGRAQASMGIAVGDVDGDDDDDLVISNFSDDYNTLYLAGPTSYDDASFASGMAEASWLKLGWGIVLFDFDNDRFLDLFVANGHVYPKVDSTDLGLHYADQDQLFRGDGSAHFTEVVTGDLGSLRTVGRGAAVSDIDNDGDLDVIVVRLDDRALIYENRASTGGFVAPLLEGRDCDRDAFGAVARLEVSATRIRRTVFSGGTYGGTSTPRLYFGVGAASGPFALDVEWPCRRRERFTLALGARPTLTEGSGQPIAPSSNGMNRPMP